MIDPDAYGELLADWCLEAKPAQQVLIYTTTLAQAPALALHNALLTRGAWPLLRLTPPGLQSEFLRRASDEQLDSFAPLELTEVESADATIWIEAPANLSELSSFAPDVFARLARARQPLQQARSAKRWAISIWPTSALAQQAGMSDRDYATFVERALFLDRPDPTAAWRELHELQATLIERLEAGREVRIEAPGTDLTLNVADRTWINSDGRRNMPSGEVFTGPLEDSATGTIRFELPAMSRGGEVSGATLRFEAGEVVEAHAERGEQHLLAALATDEGAKRLGELGVGTNTGIDRPTGSTLLDEKIAGTIHLALGRSHPETGGVNASALHWDLVCDLRRRGQLSLDGETIIRDGRLVS